MPFLLLLLLLTSCCRAPYLTVRTERIDESYLASSHIGIPNLCTSSFCGEQLVIHYRAPSLPAQLYLSLRFADHEVVTLCRELNSPSGYWLYRLVNEEYCCKGPILGYKVELHEENVCVASFKHLWADPISL